ncbi:MAG: hypothetical protein QOG00_241 [Pyrinomonadaceae bacterium]|nr:hypothetical protein [Pyrinomonadaceae bacterium]
MHTWQVNRIAVGAHAKAVCEAFRKFGKRCSVRWINRQCEASKDVRRTDYYGAFWLWFEAIYVANREGAEFLFEDFRARVQSLRDLEALAMADVPTQVARCNDEHADVIRAAILGDDSERLEREIAEAIAEKRMLLAMIKARRVMATAAQAA